MAALDFLFSDFDKEIAAISGVVKPFIWRNAIGVLNELRATLASIRQAPTGRPYPWQIRESFPLLTIASDGEYEPDNKGAHHVFAAITSTWEIMPLGNNNQGSRQSRHFVLVGQASTVVRLFEGDPDSRDKELAMWRMEIGDDASPGCHFHVHALGDRDEPPFPHSLPIPRLPGLLVSPMAVIEFVLAELFQSKWGEHAAKETADLVQWQSVQRVRLRNVLMWQAEQLQTLTGSPWTALKSQKPPANLFAIRY